MSTTGKSAVILGARSVVAQAIAREFAADGYDLVLAGRDTEEIGRIAADVTTRHQTACTALAFDATDVDSHDAFLAQCDETLGGLPTGVVLCFGYMPEQKDAEQDFALVQRIIDTNYTGSVSICERVATRFEQRGSGFIAVLTSVAGDRGRKKNYLYGASKGALNVYLQGLRNRLHAAGVQVTTIKPGFMDTAMTYGMDLPKALTASPEAAGKAIYKAIAKKRDEAYVLFMWRYIMMIIKAIPEWQFKKMDI